MHVVGHRGAAGEAPENTIAACLHAMQRGVRFIEIDLRLSANNKLVVIHDKTVDRTSYNTGPVHQFSAAQLARMDARASGAPWPYKKNAGIPTLDALLTACAGLDGLQLEVKSDTKPKLRRIAGLLAERFPTAESAANIVVTSSNSYFLGHLRDTAPHLRRGLVVEEAVQIKQVGQLQCSLCVINWSLCTSVRVRKLQAGGSEVSVWTVNNPALIKRLFLQGVDSVISDYPSMALPLVAALQR